MDLVTKMAHHRVNSLSWASASPDGIGLICSAIRCQMGKCYAITRWPRRVDTGRRTLKRRQIFDQVFAPIDSDDFPRDTDIITQNAGFFGRGNPVSGRSTMS
jgi:hypothetical protein